MEKITTIIQQRPNFKYVFIRISRFFSIFTYVIIAMVCGGIYKAMDMPINLIGYQIVFTAALLALWQFIIEDL